MDLFGAGESVVGLIVLALATSAEMVALVWAARRRGLTEVVVAGVVGAVAYNATVSIGVAALVSPLALGRHNVVITVAALTAVLPLVLFTGLRSGVLPPCRGCGAAGGVRRRGRLRAHPVGPCRPTCRAGCAAAERIAETHA